MLLAVVCIMSSHAQQYVNQVCPRCQGYGMLASYYGPVCCYTCGGSGCVVVTMPNPNYSNVSFHGTRDDGFIHKGRVELKRVGSRKPESFYLFNKGGVDYVAKKMSGPYYRLERRMTIENIDYTY